MGQVRCASLGSWSVQGVWEMLPEKKEVVQGVLVRRENEKLQIHSFKAYFHRDVSELQSDPVAPEGRWNYLSQLESTWKNIESHVPILLLPVSLTLGNTYFFLRSK